MKASSVEATLGEHALTTGQHGAAKLILTSPNRIIGVQGLAGTGKSFMLKSVTQQTTAKGYKIIALAPSSTVTSDLRKNLGVEAKTLTSFLLRPSGSKNTIVLLGESSMVSTKQMNDLLKITAERQLAKAVLIGDVNQLNSPDAGNPFDRLQNNGMRTVHMTDIVRQDRDRHRSAVRFSSMGEFRNAFDKLGADIREIPNGEPCKGCW